MPGPVMNALVFLINVIFGLYILVVIIRLLLQKLGAPYRNPISQMVIKLTQPLVRPLQRIVPGYKGFDLAIVLLLFILELLKMVVLLAVTQGTFPDVGGWFLWALVESCNDILDTYFYLIIIGAILSWIPSMQHHPLAQVVWCITSPLLALFQRFIPSLGGIDFSPLAAIIVIKLIQILVLSPLSIMTVGLALA